MRKTRHGERSKAESMASQGLRGDLLLGRDPGRMRGSGRTKQDHSKTREGPQFTLPGSRPRVPREACLGASFLHLWIDDDTDCTSDKDRSDSIHLKYW